MVVGHTTESTSGTRDGTIHYVDFTRFLFASRSDFVRTKVIQVWNKGLPLLVCGCRGTHS